MKCIRLRSCEYRSRLDIHHRKDGDIGCQRCKQRCDQHDQSGERPAPEKVDEEWSDDEELHINGQVPGL